MKKRVWIPFIIFTVLLITYLTGPVPNEPTYSEEWPYVPSVLAALQDHVVQSEAEQPVREDNQARIRWHQDSARVTEYSFVYLHGFAPAAGAMDTRST